MVTVDQYARIRLAHRDGMSIRELARRFHHSRYKIREILASPEPKRRGAMLSPIPWQTNNQNMTGRKHAGSVRTLTISLGLRANVSEGQHAFALV
jgi:hypothetical protein